MRCGAFHRVEGTLCLVRHGQAALSASKTKAPGFAGGYLLHEMGGTIESWDLVAPMLSTKRRVLRYETRGAGLSQKIRPPLAIDSMVDDLVALLDTLDIAGKVALAGIAVGGAIALHTA